MPRKIDPESIAQKILAILSDGPALTGEVAAELDIKYRIASAHMASLRRRKKVTCESFVTQVGGARVTRMLWSLAA